MCSLSSSTTTTIAVCVTSLRGSLHQYQRPTWRPRRSLIVSRRPLSALSYRSSEGSETRQRSKTESARTDDAPSLGAVSAIRLVEIVPRATKLFDLAHHRRFRLTVGAFRMVRMINLRAEGNESNLDKWGCFGVCGLDVLILPACFPGAYKRNKGNP